MDFGYLKPYMDNNPQLDYLPDSIHQIKEGSFNGVVSGDSSYGSSPLETCYQLAGFSFYQEGSFYDNTPMTMVQKIEDEAYKMGTVPSATPMFSFSSSSSTVTEDPFLGFRENGEKKKIIKAVHKNLSKNKKKTNRVKGQWTLEEDRY
jgi:hypothetical protein